MVPASAKRGYVREAVIRVSARCVSTSPVQVTFEPRHLCARPSVWRVAVKPAALRIARAGPKDLDDLVPLFDGYRQFYGQRSDPAAARAFLSDRIDRDESVIYLAHTGREPAGFAQLYPSFSSVSLKTLWILNDLFVRPDVRRGGVGRALLERARKHAIETGAKGLVLSTGVENKLAQTLYESCGWQRDDEFLQYRLFFDR